ncbi:MAG: tRNA adenosine(34) deaminase TadA [Proteobacteria bacterium]|nr:MAG: tRNA adenosine(34) deaminase TadA [Pseudomonadota bacterium]
MNGLNSFEIDTHYMQLALDQAKLAAEQDEVPVGAIIVLNNKLIAAAHNSQIQLQNPTAHAEILAIEQAAQELQNYRLPGCSLYVTLEPCLMCVGAMIHARIERLIYGASDPKSGMAETVDSQFDKSHHNHQVVVTGGVLAQQCGDVLRDFFRAKRQAQKSGEN